VGKKRSTFEVANIFPIAHNIFHPTKEKKKKSPYNFPFLCVCVSLAIHPSQTEKICFATCVGEVFIKGPKYSAIVLFFFYTNGKIKKGTTRTCGSTYRRDQTRMRLDNGEKEKRNKLGAP
jgi:hypothetical protein